MWLDLLRRLRLGGAVGAALAVLDASLAVKPAFTSCDAAVAGVLAGRSDPPAERLRGAWGDLRGALDGLSAAFEGLRRALRR